MVNKAKKINILECTLRDGSYAIEYQFTAEDTAIIAAGLEQAGFELIEIGHGLGLNASSPSIGIAAATDEEYLEAASEVLKKAKFGMFIIPGIGRIEDLELAAKYKMDFVRVGTNVTEVEQAEPYIKRAKELGMFVSSNLMKSYALPIDDFIKKARLAVKYGADVISVVDSAGGMMPQEVNTYVSRIKDEIGVKVGFHGHNNLLLAVANTIEAIKAGAEIVDSSLQGMGRSAGNAQTEVLVVVLEKQGYKTGIDLFKTMDLGEKMVRPIMGCEKGIDSISATLGYAQFHSSYLKVIYKIAQKYNVDPRKLITKVSEVDRVEVTEELADKVAQSLKIEEKDQRIFWNINIDFKEIVKKDSSLEEIARAISLEITSLAKKTGKQTVFTIAGTFDRNKNEASFPFIRQNAVYIIGNAEVTNQEEADIIAQAVDGQVDFILVDVNHLDNFSGMPEKVRKVVKQSKVLTYKDIDAQISAIDAMVGQLVDDFNNKKIVIMSTSSIGSELAKKLYDRGGKVTCISISSETNEEIDVLIGIAPYQPVINLNILKQLNKEGFVIDAGPGSVFLDAILKAHKLGIPIYRLDMRAGLSGEIVNVLETHELLEKIMGEKEIAGVRVVSGGIIGSRGDIVVDSINSPNRIVGVANGTGQLLADDEITPYIENIKKVKSEIAMKRFA